MRVYINKKNQNILSLFSGFEFVSKVELADEVIIYLNNLGAILDLFDVYNYHKHAYILDDNNKDISNVFFRIKDFFDIEKIQFENNILDVVNKMEESKNGKTNNGKTCKLL